MCTIADYDNWRTEWAFQVAKPWYTIYMYIAKVNYYKQQVWSRKLVLYYADDTAGITTPWLKQVLSNWHGTNGYAPADFVKASIYDYTV